jgi:hypothetical protein
MLFYFAGGDRNPSGRLPIALLNQGEETCSSFDAGMLASIALA